MEILNIEAVKALPVGTKISDRYLNGWTVTEEGLLPAPRRTGWLRRWEHLSGPVDFSPFTVTAEPESLPDATEDGYDWPEVPQDALADWGRELLESTVPMSVAHEAHALVYGDRNDGYGHPRRNFTRIAHMWTALLSDKLGEGEYVTPEDVGRCMVAMKLSRDVNNPKRDNRVDMAGYAIALDRLETGK